MSHLEEIWTEEKAIKVYENHGPTLNGKVYEHAAKAVQIFSFKKGNNKNLYLFFSEHSYRIYMFLDVLIITTDF